MAMHLNPIFTFDYVKHSTLKRIQNRENNLPVYFVDSSVFLEALLQQALSDECFAFFYNAGYHYRLMTSTLVLGEIIKLLNNSNDEAKKRNGSFLLFSLLGKAEIQIVPISPECLGNIGIIKSADSLLDSSDSVIFSSAITENCKAFITLDSDFSARLGLEFDILIKKPFEA